MKFEDWYRTGIGIGYYAAYNSLVSGHSSVRIEPEEGGHSVNIQTMRFKGSFFFVQDEEYNQVGELMELVSVFKNPEDTIEEIVGGNHPKFVIK